MSLPRTLRASGQLCARCNNRHSSARTFTISAKRSSAEESRLPRVANPAFWSSLVPRAFRRATDEESAAERARVRSAGYQERRTGIAFLILGILVGSNAINLISIKREMVNFSRQTDARLELLREIIQKLKDGEDVDIKRALGTGDSESEQGWEQVIRELETTDMLLEGRKKREAKRRNAEEKGGAKDVTDTPDSTNGAAQTGRPKFIM